METDARRGRAAARRLLDGRAVRVTGEDLLPREDEIAPCARTSYGIQLAPGEASALHRATAGWAIALRLALRLRDLASALPPGDDAVFTPEARADLFAYLAAEVLSRIDPRLARFLRRTAVLEVLEPQVCARLADEDRPAELIQSLGADASRGADACVSSRSGGDIRLRSCRDPMTRRADRAV